VPTNRFGYFIIKKATLDTLTNELAEAHARISSLEQRNSALEARFSRDKPKRHAVMPDVRTDSPKGHSGAWPSGL
jgi:hypothetical protein